MSVAAFTCGNRRSQEFFVVAVTSLKAFPVKQVHFSIEFKLRVVWGY